MRPCNKKLSKRFTKLYNQHRISKHDLRLVLGRLPKQQVVIPIKEIMDYTAQFTR